MQKITQNLNEFKKVVEDFLVELKKSESNVVLLSGNLGAGKTTFVQNIAKLLNIKSKIISPTFVLMKRYKLQASYYTNLYHLDAYRLEGKDIKKELEILKLEEIMKDKSNLVFIEWAEILKGYLPKKVIKINIKHKGENSREIEIKFY